MLDTANIALFLAAALVIAVTPGPGIFYVAARTLAGGRREGLASTIGTGLGGLAHIAAGAVGVSALVMASAEAFALLKLFGSLYLLWLGVKTIREARLKMPAHVALTGPTRALRATASSSRRSTRRRPPSSSRSFRSSSSRHSMPSRCSSSCSAPCGSASTRRPISWWC
jgi:threonine/homoserine/homoserine lactone efflux protein